MEKEMRNMYLPHLKVRNNFLEMLQIRIMIKNLTISLRNKIALRKTSVIIDRILSHKTSELHFSAKKFGIRLNAEKSHPLSMIRHN